MPAPSALISWSVPPRSATRSRMPRIPYPQAWSPGPTPLPSSTISRTNWPSSTRPVTSTWLAAACLITFVRLSWITRNSTGTSSFPAPSGSWPRPTTDRKPASKAVRSTSARMPRSHSWPRPRVAAVDIPLACHLATGRRCSEGCASASGSGASSCRSTPTERRTSERPLRATSWIRPSSSATRPGSLGSSLRAASAFTTTVARV